MDMGDEIELRSPRDDKVTALKNGGHRRIAAQDPVMLDEVRAGWPHPLIIGRGLTTKACRGLGLPPSTLFRLWRPPADTGRVSLAQKMVGRACGLPKARASVGHLLRQDDHRRLPRTPPGPMTRDELKDLACLGFPPTW